jgi:hypothetical protein
MRNFHGCYERGSKPDGERHIGGLRCLSMPPSITPTSPGRRLFWSDPQSSCDALHAVVAWTLRKSPHWAQCVLYSIGDRVELHIRMTEEVIVSQYCRGSEHAAFVADVWFGALIARGWREDASRSTQR